MTDEILDITATLHSWADELKATIDQEVLEAYDAAVAQGVPSSRIATMTWMAITTGSALQKSAELCGSDRLAQGFIGRLLADPDRYLPGPRHQ